jgi:CobQ-like glutamine amidotransferase family enzyme
MLAICGGYQLLGKYFLTKDDKKILGLGLLNFYTKGGDTRMIGNIVIESHDLKLSKIIGFENHSGKTYLRDGIKSFGNVIKGYGNNGEDMKEGVMSNNFIGTYMHGPLLPKNSDLTDWFIKTSLEQKYKKHIKLNKIDDIFEQNARNYMYSRI